MSVKFRPALVAGLLSAAIAVPAYAGGSFEGFHLGASVGPQFGAVEATFPGAKTDLGPTGFAAGVSGGYAFSIAPRWLLDVEATFDWNDAKADLLGATSIKTGLGFGGALSVGYQFDRSWLGYAKAGYQSTAFKVEGSDEKRLGGVLLGGGLRKGLGDGWSAKAEYDYVFYPSFTDSIYGVTWKPSASILKFGVDYSFDGRLW
ncbi:hypothetical protein ACVIGB_000110 [Bradyrhizobium sp. USDA 4341]